jgi:signal transduction histidine kinase
MTELIDSLLEFSRTRASLRPVYGTLQHTVASGIEAVKSNPQFRDVRINVRQNGNVEGWFDHRKLERVFSNLLLNACEAVDGHEGRIDVLMNEIGNSIEIRIQDNGHGIPDEVRNVLFDPFVSQGKENGTGLGLTVVQKIVQDHGGEVMVETTSSKGTVFRVVIPRPAPVSAGLEQAPADEPLPVTQAGANAEKLA